MQGGLCCFLGPLPAGGLSRRKLTKGARVQVADTVSHSPSPTHGDCEPSVDSSTPVPQSGRPSFATVPHRAPPAAGPPRPAPGVSAPSFCKPSRTTSTSGDSRSCTDPHGCTAHPPEASRAPSGETPPPRWFGPRRSTLRSEGLPIVTAFGRNPDSQRPAGAPQIDRGPGRTSSRREETRRSGLRSGTNRRSRRRRTTKRRRPLRSQRSIWYGIGHPIRTATSGTRIMPRFAVVLAVIASILSGGCAAISTRSLAGGARATSAEGGTRGDDLRGSVPIPAERAGRRAVCPSSGIPAAPFRPDPPRVKDTQRQFETLEIREVRVRYETQPERTITPRQRVERFEDGCDSREGLRVLPGCPPPTRSGESPHHRRRSPARWHPRTAGIPGTVLPQFPGLDRRLVLLGDLGLTGRRREEARPVSSEDRRKPEPAKPAGRDQPRRRLDWDHETATATNPPSPPANSLSPQPPPWDSLLPGFSFPATTETAPARERTRSGYASPCLLKRSVSESQNLSTSSGRPLPSITIVRFVSRSCQ